MTNELMIIGATALWCVAIVVAVACLIVTRR